MMKVLIAFLAFLFCFGLGALSYSNSRERGQAALDHFYNYRGFSDKRTTPLHDGGPAVVPLVIENVKNREMPYRLDAIAFLHGKVEALPVLEHIVNDEAEETFTRKEALWSVFHTEKDSARKLAEQYKDRDDFLGAYSKCILTKDTCI